MEETEIIYPIVDVVTPSTGSLFEIKEMRSFLKLSGNGTEDENAFLSFLVSFATEWTEQRTEKTLLTKTLQVTHRNNEFVLPRGPVAATDILEVKRNGKKMESKDYALVRDGDSVRIRTAFRWKEPKIEVTYKAGYGAKPEHVPPTLRRIVQTLAMHFFEHPDDMGDPHLIDKSDVCLYAYKRMGLA